MKSTRRNLRTALAVGLFVIVRSHSLPAKTNSPPELPPQEIIDAAFKVPPPPVQVRPRRQEIGLPIEKCGLIPADLEVTRADKSRTYKVLVKAPDTAPFSPTEAFFRVSRFTVDADGSSRAYHPDDPKGVGVCRLGQPDVCALDQLANADVALFQGTAEIEQSHENYRDLWASAWNLIKKDATRSVDHRRDPRIPDGSALYYFKDASLIVVFNTNIIPFRNGAPCMRGPKRSDPGYFVAATTFQKTRTTAASVCDPSHYLDASKIPFVVVPGNTFGAVQAGDIAVGYADSSSGERLVFGIVGDLGPPFKTAEGSIAFNSKLLRRTKPLENSLEQDSIDIELGTDGIVAMGFLILGGTKAQLRGDYSAGNIAAIGNRLLKHWSSGSKPENKLRSCLDAAPLNAWK